MTFGKTSIWFMDIRVKVEKRYWQKTYAAFQENLQSIDGNHKKLKIFACLTGSLQVVLQKKYNLNLTKVDLFLFTIIIKFKNIPLRVLFFQNILRAFTGKAIVTLKKMY